MGDLDGLLVVALEQAVAAPFASAMLAHGGARVIKIERPEGDFARDYDRHVRGQSAYFVWLNAGKESICLDLRTAADRELLARLIAKADVFIQNLKPGALGKLGFDAAALRLANPALITCDISGFGRSGPIAARKAYDLIVQAETGLCSITGGPTEPARVGVSICDIAAGATAHAAILQALVGRSRTGRGRGIEVSLFDSLAHWMAVPLLQHVYGSQAIERAGVSHPTIAPYGAFACRGGERVIFSIQNEREWAAFSARFMERPDLTNDPRFLDNTARVANRGVLDSLVGRLFARLSVEDAEARLAGLGVAFGRLNDLAEACVHPHLRQVSVQTPNGEVQVVAPAAILSDGTPDVGPTPALGEHGAAIRAEFTAENPSVRADR